MASQSKWSRLQSLSLRVLVDADPHPITLAVGVHQEVLVVPGVVLVA